MSGSGWFLASLVALCVLVLALNRWHRRRRGQQAAVPSRRAPVITDPFKVMVLEHACGPCNNVAAARTCICAGYCGHRFCRGRAATADMATALQRITREDGAHG